jgi:predicted enzyme related to lactoylglutathione lyase
MASVSESTAAEVRNRPQLQASSPLLRKVDAATFPISTPACASTATAWVTQLLWRNDDLGQAALGVPASDTEIVLTSEHGYEPNWLVHSADEAADRVEEEGGRVLAPAFDIPVGRVAVVEDSFGNVLVLIDPLEGPLQR